MTFSLRVREVNFIKHEIEEYIIVSMYLSRINEQSNKVLTLIIKKLHLVDDFKVKMFIENDILESKVIVINVIKRFVYINNCNVKVNIHAR